MTDRNRRYLLVCAAGLALMIGGCSKQPEQPKEAAKEEPKPAPPPPVEEKKAEPEKKAEAPKKKELMPATAPAEFNVKFATTAGDFTVTVHKNWSPIGAQR